jgi:hypothetical protein
MRVAIRWVLVRDPGGEEVARGLVRIVWRCRELL